MDWTILFLLDSWLFVDYVPVECHIMREPVVERPFLVENLENLYPLADLVPIVARKNLHSVNAIVFSPVWPGLKLLEKFVFHALLKFVNAERSREKWYLGIIIIII